MCESAGGESTKRPDSSTCLREFGRAPLGEGALALPGVRVVSEGAVGILSLALPMKVLRKVSGYVHSSAFRAQLTTPCPSRSEQ